MASIPNMIASGTIRAMRFIKVSGDGTVAEADANELVCGISGRVSRRWDDADAADSGEPVSVQDTEEAYLVCGDTVTAGTRLKSDADGRGVAIATTGTTIQNVGAIALQSGLVNGIIKVRPYIDTVRPALT